MSEMEDVDGIEIIGEYFIIRYLPLRRHILGDGILIQAGDLLGYIVSPSGRSDIVYSSVEENRTHLHLEVEVISLTEASFPSGVMIDGKCYLNHLYLSKTGRLSLPFNL